MPTIIVEHEGRSNMDSPGVTRCSPRRPSSTVDGMQRTWSDADAFRVIPAGQATLRSLACSHNREEKAMGEG